LREDVISLSRWLVLLFIACKLTETEELSLPFVPYFCFVPLDFFSFDLMFTFIDWLRVVFAPFGYFAENELLFGLLMLYTGVWAA